MIDNVTSTSYSEKKYLVLFPTNEIFEEYVKKRSKDFRAAIIFDGDDTDISYTIRYHNDAGGVQFLFSSVVSFLQISSFKQYFLFLAMQFD